MATAAPQARPAGGEYLTSTQNPARGRERELVAPEKFGGLSTHSDRLAGQIVPFMDKRAYLAITAHSLSRLKRATDDCARGDAGRIETNAHPAARSGNEGTTHGIERPIYGDLTSRFRTIDSRLRSLTVSLGACDTLVRGRSSVHDHASFPSASSRPINPIPRLFARLGRLDAEILSLAINILVQPHADSAEQVDRQPRPDLHGLRIAIGRDSDSGVRGLHERWLRNGSDSVAWKPWFGLHCVAKSWNGRLLCLCPSWGVNAMTAAGRHPAGPEICCEFAGHRFATLE